MARRELILAVAVALSITTAAACDSNARVTDTVPADVMSWATSQAGMLGEATFRGALVVDDLPAYCPGVCDQDPGPGWVVIFEVVRPDERTDEVRVIFRQDGTMVATQY